MKKTNIVAISVEELFPEPCPIELLGYAKNDIVEVKRLAYTLPKEQLAMLSKAYALLDGVQEYIFNDPLVA